MEHLLFSTSKYLSFIIGFKLRPESYTDTLDEVTASIKHRLLHLSP